MVSRAYAGRKAGGCDEAKKDECLMPERMWKYARVASTKTEMTVSMGEKTVCVDSGRDMARILGDEWESKCECGREDGTRCSPINGGNK